MAVIAGLTQLRDLSAVDVAPELSVLWSVLQLTQLAQLTKFAADRVGEIEHHVLQGWRYPMVSKVSVGTALAWLLACLCQLT